MTFVAALIAGALPGAAVAGPSLIHDADAPVREIVMPADGSAGVDGPRGALRLEPSGQHLFGGEADRPYRVGRIPARALAGLPAAAIASRLRGQIDGGCVIGGRDHGCASHLVVVTGVDVAFADRRGGAGERFAAAMRLLARPTRWGGTYAGRVHVTLAPAAVRAIRVGRGPDHNLDSAGRAVLPRWRSVMAGLARSGGVWLQMSPASGSTPLSSAEWSHSTADVVALYRRAGGRLDRLHYLFARAARVPAGSPGGCGTPMACQWLLADRGVGARILRNGPGAWQVGDQAAEWRRQFNLRFPPGSPPGPPPGSPPPPASSGRLAVTVNGHGSVTSSPAGIACGADCDEVMPLGTQVTLTASAAPGYRWDGWSGACAGTGPCVVTLAATSAVQATFVKGPPVLTVARRGTGSGSVASSPAGILCGTTCQAGFAAGTTVTLVATPGAGSTLVGWMGAGCSGTGPCTVALERAATVHALFAPAGAATEARCTVARASGSTPTISATHPKVLFVDPSVAACLQHLLANDVTAATRFTAMVDQQMASNNVYAYQAWYSALMYRVTGEVRYANDAVARTESFVAAEEALIAAGERPTIAYDSYLEVGDHIANVMLVYDWCYDLLTPAQRARWLAYANQAVWNVWHHTQATWGGNAFPWSGWSVDNPSNNYYYSFLRATMLLGLASHGEHAAAQGWVDQFRTTKLANQLFPTFNANLLGGGSREGTGYGTAMRSLFTLYDWWERSTGERIATQTPHTLASMAHTIHTIVPTLDRLAPTGDHARDETAALFDYHRDYLLQLMNLFPNERLSGVAATLLSSSSVPQMANRFMFPVDFLVHPPAMTSRPLTELTPAYWASGTGQFLMRSGWDPDATWADFICGPYDESHAHHDQGSFTLYKGAWLAFDANQISHSGIEQGEENHNLVRIEQNGATVTQVEGAPRCDMVALTSNDRFSYGLANVTPVYSGKSAVQKVEREFLFLRPDAVVVFDRVATSGAGVRRIWTLNSPTTPVLDGNTISVASAGNQLDVFRLAPADAAAALAGPNRVEVVHATGSESLFLNVLGTNGAVVAAARADDTGRTGTQITFADGGSATVRFANTGRGGHLTLRAAGGAVTFDGPLPAGVSAPPLFVN